LHDPAEVIRSHGRQREPAQVRDAPQRQLDRALVEPRLLKTPLVRIDQRVSVGYTPDDWSAWIKQ